MTTSSNNNDTLLPNEVSTDTKEDKEVPPKTEEPSKKRCCFGIVGFVINLGMLNVLLMTMNVYNMAVVRTLEKRFSLTSTQTGIVWSMNDVTHICLVLLAGYFGRSGHKPKIISATMAFAAVGTFLMMSPYFLFPLDIETETIANVTVAVTRVKEPLMCVGNSTQGDDKCFDENGDSIGQSVHPALYVFCVAQLLCGVGGCALGALGLSYIDENSPNNRVSLYIGIVTSFFAIGPVCGHLLSSVTLRIAEDPTSEMDITPQHPMWIGCWWLGYLIVAIAMTAAVVPMWFFPKHMNPLLDEKKAKKPKHTPTVKAAVENIKTFPRMAWALLKNWALLIMIISSISMAYIIQSIFAPMVRYMEVHFMLPAYKAALITGLSSAGGGVIGGIIGGAIMAILKLKAKGAVVFLIICGIISAACVITELLLKCPQPEMVGSFAENGGFSVDAVCNKECSCPTGHGSYSPICGSDGKNYYSPCFAGCTDTINSSGPKVVYLLHVEDLNAFHWRDEFQRKCHKTEYTCNIVNPHQTFSDCSCISPTNVTMETEGPSFSTPSLGWATRGLCPVQCAALVPYCIAVLCMCLCASISRVPGTIILFRIVKPEEKSFAMGINSFAMNLFGMIPGPILIGALIDRTCQLWQRNCNGSGVCLLFDTTQLRQYTYGLATVCFLFPFFLMFPLYYFVSKIQHEQEKTEKEVKKNEEEEEERLLDKLKHLDILDESKV
ncbi:hypothetical protein CAPTEDRAFT_187732 [Capitella teleta]|uniref:Kazal-like domain-containing protein n=1 Tax=Capitella teleta TaxID=283909 RepID=R7UPH2_CAPTE|nr:hypothetical protein CAPTEDRAFT_187732 [Capitella teleta]|eukprot:ELU08003.1 hypothetical protein CAPTEDRAFT_187732 [Capitella teleta]